jgi:serine/threonine protein phosphatase 1
MPPMGLPCARRNFACAPTWCISPTVTASSKTGTDSKPQTTRPSAAKRLMKAMGMGARAPASLPDKLRLYAVGDLHGCAGLLDELHAKIEEDAAGYPHARKIVYLGDFTDRGTDSKGVVDRVLHRVPRGFEPHYVRGNHDVTLLEFLEDPEVYRLWRPFGGAETLMSYGVRPPLFDSAEQMEKARDAFKAALPAEHLAFFQSLELTITVGDYLFVHAGIRPGIALEKQSEQDLLWIRDEFLSSSAWSGKVVVHGHTPLPAPVRTANRISVDTGAYATGNLSCAVLEGTSCRFLQASAA